MVQVAEARPRALWGTFDGCRERLFRQYQTARFDPATGLAPDALAAAVDAYLASHPEQPRVLQKAHVFRIVVTQGQIAIDPEDWFVDKLNCGWLPFGSRAEGSAGQGGFVRKLSLDWLDEAIEGELAESAGFLHRAYASGQATGPKGGLDRGHISPGWDTLFANGLVGLLEKVAAARQALGERATAEQLAFYEAVEIVYRAALVLAERFARLARQLAAEQPEHRARLELIAEALDNVPAHRPRTFHEALQFHWFLHEVIELEGEYVRSAGQFDRSFYPFYEADVAAGRLTRDQAKELIKFFWYKWYARTQGRENGKNFCFGGQYADGTLIENDLTYLALEAYAELDVPDPKLSVRFLPGTSDRLYRRVAELIRAGHTSIVLLNDAAAVEALVKRGIAREDARLHLPIGCYEPVVEGKGVGCTMNLTVNLAKGVELALNRGVDPLSGESVGPDTGDPRDFADFEALWQAYVQQMDAFLDRAAASIRAAERAWPRINPSPVVAATIEDCIARGQDVGQGGAHYNSVGFVGAGLANAADSLLAVKQAVFEERHCTLDELGQALRADFVGHERLRQYLLNRVPKWGNNHPAADELAKRIADYYCAKIHGFTNARGGPCLAALFTLTFALEGGLKTGALPDGRKARESLAPGLGASYGRDRNSVTALIDSVVKLDATEMPDGAVLDVTLHPTAVAGEDGLESLVALIKAFLGRGGYAVQFNVFDVATLRDAQRYPDRYQTLQVRVTGWSVYYTSLSRQEQDQYISRIAHGI